MLTTGTESRFGLLAVVILGALGAPTPATYETRTVDERQFMVAKDGAMEVWFSATRGSEEIGAYFLIVNDGDEAIDVFPQRVRAEAITISAKGRTRARLRTYHPAQYESMVRKRKWHFGGLGPDPPPSMSKGLPGDTVAGSTGPPRTNVETECDFGNKAACAYLGRHGRRLEDTSRSYTAAGSYRRAIATLGDTLTALLWPSKVSRHESHGGVVYMKYRPGDSYHLSVPIGETSFEFDFELPGTGESTSD